jgi:hypothetical protein
VTHCPREKAVSGAQIQRGIYIRGGYNGEEGGVGREMVVEPVEGWARRITDRWISTGGTPIFWLGVAVTT